METLPHPTHETIPVLFDNSRDREIHHFVRCHFRVNGNTDLERSRRKNKVLLLTGKITPQQYDKVRAYIDDQEYRLEMLKSRRL